MKKIIVAFFIIANVSASFGEELKIHNYLNQVEENNDSYEAVQNRRSAFINQQAEAELLYVTSLKASVNHTDDRRPTTSSTFQGNKTIYDTASAGVAKKTGFGSEVSLTYNISKTEIFGASPQLVPQNQFHENYSKFEISQSLIRNSLGSETSAREKIITMNSKAGILSQEYKRQIILNDAESLYYQVLIASKFLKVQEDSLKRADEIRRYNKKRFESKLSDKADYLQSVAALKLREIDVLKAKTNLRTISRLFNSYRGMDSDDVEKLDWSLLKEISKLQSPLEMKSRADTMSLKFQSDSQKAQSKLNEESLRPDLKLVASSSFYGRKENFNESLDKSFSTKHPVYAIGLTFSMPLDSDLKEKARATYRLNSIASDLEYRRRLLEQKSEWNNLLSTFKEYKEQLNVYNELEAAQLAKLLNEKSRQKRAQSTTFQVLSFEQEYLSTQANLLQQQLNLVSTYVQLKLFNQEEI